MNRTEYKNKHRKEHYDSILFVFPKGEKDRIKQTASELKMSVNEYLYALCVMIWYLVKADWEKS